MPHYIAIFMDGGGAYPTNPCLAEIEIFDTTGRRLVPSNATVLNQTANTQNFTNGNATDNSTTTYYYSSHGLNDPFIAHYTDGAAPTSARFYLGMTNHANYGPTSLRFYVSTTNHGLSESSWPAQTKKFTTGTTQQYGEWSQTFSISTNSTPAVSNITPNGTAVDPRNPITISWTYNDIDGNPQNGYELRFRKFGTTGGWATVSGTTQNSVTFGAGNFTLGEQYEYQIRVSDAIAGYGEWSAVHFFTAAVDTWKTGTMVTSSTNSGTIPGPDIYNQGFETNTTGWESNPVFGTYNAATFARTTTRPRTGSYSLEVTWPTGPSWVNTLSEKNLVAGAVYTMAADLYVPAGSPDVQLDPLFQPRIGGTGAGGITTFTQKDQWFTATQDFALSPGYTDTYFGIRCVTNATSGQKMWVDNVRIYQELPTDAGDYIVQVRAADSAGEWSPWSASSDFIVRPLSNVWVKQGGVWKQALNNVRVSGAFKQVQPTQNKSDGTF